MESDKPAIPGAEGSTATTVTSESAPSVQVDPHLVARFRGWLDQDAWQVDVHWSVLTTDRPCPSRPWRWLYVAASARPDQQGAVETDDAVVWNHVWSGTPERMTAGDRQAADSVLAALSLESGRIGRNALILQARLSPAGNATLLTKLQELCESEETAVALAARCAAAEVWCRCLALQDLDRDVALLPAGKLLQRPGLAEELRGTLWRNLSPEIPPDRLPALPAAVSLANIDTTPPSRRIAALEACVLAAASRRQIVLDTKAHNTRPESPARTEDWPPGLTGLRFDEDPIIRRLVGRWAAWAGSAEALTLLAAQVQDVDPIVQESALVGLGILKTPDALKVLQQLAGNPRSPHRVQAVQALAQYGASELQPYVISSNREIRAAVARGLAAEPGATGLQMLQQLLTDPSPDVQAAAIATASSLPEDQSIPLLLLAVEQSGFNVRKSAQLALSRLITDPPLLPIEAGPIERRDAVRLWAATHGYSLVTWSAPAELRQSDVAASHRQELIELLESSLAPETTPDRRTELLEALRRLVTAEDVLEIERQLRPHSGIAVRELQQELLPVISPAYTALRDMQTPDLQQRRSAAGRLSACAKTHPLSPDLIRLLADALVQEQDRLVWQSCLAALREDSHDAAAQVALLAVHNVWPDLRRLGAEYFILHPAAESVPALLPLLQDPHPHVQLAAIQALGKSGNPLAIAGLPGSATVPATGGLQALKSATNEDVRWAAIIALVRLHDESTSAELQRLIRNPLPQERLRAVQAIGASQDSRLIGPLLQLSWTESNTAVKRAIVQSLEELVPEPERPVASAAIAGLPGIDDQLQSWVKWWDTRQPESRVTADSRVTRERPYAGEGTR